MDRFTAQKAGADISGLEHGYGAIVFQWADPAFGHEGLTIDLSADSFGHCSREMPIRSGKGPPKIVCLERNKVVIRFAPDLARQLELSEEVEIAFDVSEEVFAELKTAIEFIDEVNLSRSKAAEKMAD